MGQYLIPVMLRVARWCSGLLVCVLIFGAQTAGAAAEEDRLFDSLQQRLIKEGFDATYIQQLYGRPEVKAETRGVALFFVHRESKVNYGQFTDEAAIKKGKAYMQQHREAMTQTESKFGVDATVITAIALVETRLGTHLGKRSVLNTLSSMAALEDPQVRDTFWKMIRKPQDLTRNKYDKKVRAKSHWAYKELKALLQYAIRDDIDPTLIKGSYAGAVGIAQFMPSNILVYAADGDGNGRVDLFTHEDAIASIASYLKRFGWKPGIERQAARKVIYRYNKSNYYVDTILKIADLLKADV
jgi:membrane-bound lytic murein transglycosylase B